MTRAGARIRRVVPNVQGDRVAESRAFYEDVIGLKLGMDLGWIVSFGSPTNPTAQLSVISRDASAGVHPDVSIEVEDVDVVHAQALAQGAEILHPLTDEPWGVRRFFVRDPNGAVVNVMMHLSE
jgi:catechol 2,3-dioxygenase-like lactoylglutathione lyase family enzyme